MSSLIAVVRHPAPDEEGKPVVRGTVAHRRGRQRGGPCVVIPSSYSGIPWERAEAAANLRSVGEIRSAPARVLERMARLVVWAEARFGDYAPATWRRSPQPIRLMEATWRSLAEATWNPAADEYRQRVIHGVQRSVADRMMQEASSAGNPAEVRAVLSDRLERLAAGIETTSAPSPHQRLVAADIRRWQARIENTVPGPQLQMLAGDPIGGSNRN